MVIFVIFIFGAILFSFYVSFFDYQLLAKGGIGQLFTDPGKRWVGLDNYRHIIHNKDFWTAFRNTSWYALGVVPAQTMTGLVLAVLANRKDSRQDLFSHRLLFPLDQLIGRDFDHFSLDVFRARRRQLYASTIGIPDTETDLARQSERCDRAAAWKSRD